MYLTTDDKYTGPETAKKVISRFDPSYHRIINDNMLSHVGTIWAWDARCSIYDEFIDSFDQLELKRAGQDGNNTSTTVTDSSNIDEERRNYRLVTVPKFMKSLPFERTCPEGTH